MLHIQLPAKLLTQNSSVDGIIKDNKGQLSRYRESLRAGRSGDRILVGARFSAPDLTEPGTHTPSSPGLKRPEACVDQPLPLAPRFNKEYNHNSTPPVGLYGLLQGETYPNLYSGQKRRLSTRYMNSEMFYIQRDIQCEILYLGTSCTQPVQTKCKFSHERYSIFEQIKHTDRRNASASKCVSILYIQ